MELNEYQKRALETAIYPSDTKIVYPTLGITGEAGEVADKVKKVIRDNNGNFSEEKRFEIAKEVGDVLWYIANLANDLGYKTMNSYKQLLKKVLKSVIKIRRKK